MKSFRRIATVVALAVMAGFAQQSTTAPGSSDSQHANSAHTGVPTVEQHLKVLTEKLDLSSDQQAKIKPALQELHEATSKLAEDTSLSPEQLREHLRTLRQKANKQIRETLNESQKNKLDELEHEPHSGLHGNSGTPQGSSPR